MFKLIHDLKSSQVSQKHEVHLLQQQQQSFQNKYNADNQRVKEIPQMNSTLQKMHYEVLQLTTQIARNDAMLEAANVRMEGHHETFDIKFNGQEAKLKELDMFARRPTDYYEKI